MRDLVGAGARLAARLFTFPMPVVAACTGHALAMGSIILLTCDARIGAEGDFKVGLNEVAIGMVLPDFALQFARYRMPPSQYDSALLGRVFPPAAAVTAGYLDRVVPADDVVAEARREATELAALEPKVVGATKRRARQPLADAILARLDADMSGVAPPPA
jgi:enoyl-CoA hydratase